MTICETEVFIDVKTALKESEMLEIGRDQYDVDHMIETASRLSKVPKFLVSEIYIQEKGKHYEEIQILR